MKLNIQTAVNNKIVRQPAASKQPERIYKYITSNFARLIKSLMQTVAATLTVLFLQDSQAQLELKAVGKADSVENENVMVFLKVGIEKGYDQETGATELKVPLPSSSQF